VGSPVVNRIRLTMAVFMAILLNWLVEGQLIPVDAEGFRWRWLVISGAIGFVIGDALLFQAFVMIGARLSMLLMALAPVFSVILSWIFLEEHLVVQELLGIGLAVGGVIWVVTDRTGDTRMIQLNHGNRYYLIGVLCGLGGAIGQAVGLIMSKQGLADDFSPISGNVIRLISATLLIWIMTIVQGQTQNTLATLRRKPHSLKWITIGAVFGPFIGVSLSLLAVQKAPVGIASTLMQLTPIILLPIGYFVFHEQIGKRAVVGTVLAIVGTAAIFLHV
jgi:drug/metabolite transporter (DMT)-like permease